MNLIIDISKLAGTTEEQATSLVRMAGYTPKSIIAGTPHLLTADNLPKLVILEVNHGVVVQAYHG